MQVGSCLIQPTSIEPLHQEVTWALFASLPRALPCAWSSFSARFKQVMCQPNRKSKYLGVEKKKNTIHQHKPQLNEKLFPITISERFITPTRPWLIGRSCSTREDILGVTASSCYSSLNRSRRFLFEVSFCVEVRGARALYDSFCSRTDKPTTCYCAPRGCYSHVGLW